MSDLHPLLRELIGPARGATGTPAKASGALAYVRVSTDMQEDRGLSIPAQQKAVEAYAADHGIAILQTYVEAASSYQDESKRAEFQRMFERAKSDPQVGVVLVHESSRFCRHPWRTPQLIGELQDAGVRVISATEPEYDVNTVMGMWMQKVTEAKNASYSMEVAFHTRKGMRQNANMRDPETGWCYKNGGRPAWGYRTTRIERTDVRGRPRFKAVWELNTEEIAGRPVWEWTREMLGRAGEGVAQQVRAGAIGDAGRSQIPIHQQRNAAYREAAPAAIEKQGRLRVLAVGEVGQQRVGRGAADGQPTQPSPLAHHLQCSPSFHGQHHIIATQGAQLPHPQAGVVQQHQDGAVPPASVAMRPSPTPCHRPPSPMWPLLTGPTSTSSTRSPRT